MTIPTGGAATVYGSSSKRSESRVIMGVRYPAWTQTFTHDFTTDGLPTSLFRVSPIPPLVDSSGLHFRNYYDGNGSLVTPFEEVIHRPGQIPVDPSVAFKITINFEVHLEDPVYDQAFAIYGINGPFGAVSDPLRVVFLGSASNVPNAGSLVLYPGNVFPSWKATNDLKIPWDAMNTEHEVEVIWDPAGPHFLTINFDSVEVFTSDAVYDEVAVGNLRPYGIGYGLVWTQSVGTLSGAPGTFDDVLTIKDVTVDELDSGGFETRIFPGWTSPNVSATSHDNALPGERYDLDGETWARFADSLVAEWNTDGEVFNLTLVPEADDPDVLHWTHWKHRPILIDTRINAVSGNTGWKRLIAGRIEKVNTSVNADGVPRVVVSGRSIPQLKLANTIPTSFIPSATASQMPGVHTRGAGNSALTFQRVFEIINEIGNELDGSTLPTGVDVKMPDIRPLTLNGGAQELLTNWREWADRLSQQAWVRYAVTGDDRYGTLVVHLWDTEPGTAYPFTVGNGVAAQIDDDDRNGPGQVFIHPNLSRVSSSNWIWLGKPGAAAYPTYPYPAHGFAFSDTSAYSNQIAVGPLTNFPDRAGVNRTGGQAKLRLYAELSRERTISLKVVDHDWMHPGDTISFNGSIYLDTDETWIVERVSYRMGVAGLEATIDAFSTDIVGVMTR